MKFTELLAAMPEEMVDQLMVGAHDGRSDGAPDDGNPCRAWLAAVARREMARRRGEPLPAVPPLEIERRDAPAVLAWLEVAGELVADEYVKVRDPALVLAGALFHMLWGLIAAQRGGAAASGRVQ